MPIVVKVPKALMLPLTLTSRQISSDLGSILSFQLRNENIVDSPYEQFAVAQQLDNYNQVCIFCLSVAVTLTPS